MTICPCQEIEPDQHEMSQRDLIPQIGSAQSCPPLMGCDGSEMYQRNPIPEIGSAQFHPSKMECVPMSIMCQVWELILLGEDTHGAVP